MNRFEITKHYDVVSSDGAIVIRETEVVVRDGKVFRWTPGEGILHLMATPHMKSASEAYSNWKEQIEERLRQHKQFALVLEK